MAGDRRNSGGGRQGGTPALTPYAAAQVGGERRRRKSPDGCEEECGLCYGMRGRIGEPPPPPTRVARSGCDLPARRNNNTPGIAEASSCVVYVRIAEASSRAAYVRNAEACHGATPCYLAICDRTVNCDITNDYHSKYKPGKCRRGRSEVRATASQGLDVAHYYPTRSDAACTFRPTGHQGKRQFFFSVVFYWLVGQALLSSPGRGVHGAAVPPAAYFSSIPTSAGSRYQLVSPALNNDSIFIFFNPSSIIDLKVNTRQFVYFNFTLYTRQSRGGSSSRIGFDPRQSTTTHPGKSLQASYNDNHLDSLVSPQETANSSASATTKAFVSTNNNSSGGGPLKAALVLSSSQTTAYTSARPVYGSRQAERKPAQPPNAPSYRVMIYSDDDSIARPLPNGWAAAHVDAKGTYILMAVTAGRQHNFSVEARHIGRVTMSVAVVGDKEIPAGHVHAVAATQYQVTTVRGERPADIVFNSAAAAIAIIISFGIGAITDLDSLKRQVKHPVALIIGFCCQFIIMPVLAFGMAMLLPLERDISFGLLCVACVPGGGLSHVAVVIADGDTALSLTMNLITVVAMLVTAPLWLFVLGQYFQNSDAVIGPRNLPIYYFEIWLAATFFAYAFGLIIKRVRPAVADAILMWLIKPFLLLASILYITLGVYINMYVFELVNTYALLGAMFLPLCGFVVGAAMAVICRQNLAFVKTIALETSSLNCLVVMVALRFSLKQPDADLAAMIPIWVMFTIPGLFVSLAICNKAKVVVMHYWHNRNNKDSDMQNSSKAYSVSSSVVSPPGTTTLSAPLVTADGMDDDATISTMSNQKVTVL